MNPMYHHHQGYIVPGPYTPNGPQMYQQPQFQPPFQHQFTDPNIQLIKEEVSKILTEVSKISKRLSVLELQLSINKVNVDSATSIIESKKKEAIIAKQADNEKTSEEIKDISRKSIIESEEVYKKILSEHKPSE